MGLNWKQIPLDETKGQWSALYATINREGYIVISRVTWQKLGEPEAVFVLFDDVNQIIGLQPTSPNLRNAYPLRQRGPCKARRVSVYRLLQDYNVRIDKTLQFLDASIDFDGVLNLNLRTALVPARVRNHHHNRPKLPDRAPESFPPL